jgi:predicted metal-dependent hydrolase
MARTTQKTMMDPEIGEVTFRKSVRGRRVAIRVHPVRGVTVSVPTIVPYAAAMAFFKLKRQWVLDAVRRQKDRLKDTPVADPSEIETLRKRAKAELPTRLSVLASRYGFIYNKVTIKHNSSNWGSCSSKGNLNFNCLLALFPIEVIDSVVVHELCHRKHMNHSPQFYAEVEKVFPEYRKWHKWLKDNGGAYMGRVPK